MNTSEKFNTVMTAMCAIQDKMTVEPDGENKHLSAKYATPDRCIVTMGVLALVLALTGSFVQLAVASSVARLLAYIICISSLPAIRRKADEETRREAYRLPGGYAIPGVGLVICVWLLTHSKAESWVALSILVAIGLVLYALEKQVARR